MKNLFLFCCLAVVSQINAQSYSSAVEIPTVYSENGEYLLKSIPWDNVSPSVRGTTSVYRKNSGTPIYSFKRGFDRAEGNRLTLSNDGEIIFYVIDWDADEEKDGLKSISIYRKGEMIASYTESEITACDEKRERCSLLYNNYETVVDIEKTRIANKRVLRDDVDPKERFLYEYPLFSSGDFVYLVDSKKNVHRFDLLTGKHSDAIPFETEFERLRTIARQNKVDVQIVPSVISPDFPKLRSGKDTHHSLAEKLGMKVYDSTDTKDEQYKAYRIKLNAFLVQDGSVEIESIETADGLSRDKITEFFTSNKFDTTPIPPIFDKWYFDEEYFYFRKADNKLARQERKVELRLMEDARRRNLLAETINGRYIPKDLGDSFVELDKTLNEADRKEMLALKDRGDMLLYHMGLGMWMRNNWGLWGGSRLQKYFTDRGVDHPDNMSGVILDYYYDWLRGNKESWKEWEKKALQPKAPQRRKKNGR